MVLILFLFFIISLSDQQTKPMNQAKPSRRRFLPMEKFISILLIFRNQLTDIPPQIYYIIVAAFFAGKYIKQGNTLGSVVQYVSLLILISGDILESNILSHFGVILAVLNAILISPTLYTLPQYNPKVGLRDNYSKRNNKQLYWVEWYPISQEQKYELYQISWDHTKELNKIVDYLKVKSRFVLALFKFFSLSYLHKYRITLAKGTPGKSRQTILFSHGRTGTPFFYTTILKKLASNFRIICPQHSQVTVTPYTDVKEIKRYREIQVKQRGDEINFLTSRIKQQEQIILMGHSYGCSTVLRAYHDMHLSIRKRVTHIVLLDPWLFPLTDEAFQDEIICPILVLANEYFLQNEDVYQRNRLFIKRHSSRMLYICWKGGDHLHQTDMPFILGNSLRRIRNSHQGEKMNERNLEAIELFLQKKKLSYQQTQSFIEKFKQFDMGKDFKPAKFKNSLNF